MCESDLDLRNVKQSWLTKEESFFNLYSHALQLHGYQADQVLFYGEILFLLAGLKPCVLLSMPECPHIINAYIESCVVPLLSSLKLSCTVFQIESNITTESMPLQHAWICCHEKDKEKLYNVFHSKDSSMSDAILKDLLDYPGTLPRDEQDAMKHGLVEVAYMDMEGSRIVTTFGARETERQDVMRHFQHYKTTVASCMELKLVWNQV